jgi:hypothetical protein
VQKRAGGLAKGNAGGLGHRRREAAHAAAQKCAPHPSSHVKITTTLKEADGSINCETFDEVFRLADIRERILLQFQTCADCPLA